MKAIERLLLAGLLIALSMLSSLPALAGGHANFTGLVTRYANTVVSIHTTRETPSEPNASDLSVVPQDPPFGGFPSPDTQPPTPGGSLGSGFIVSPDGYILTNAHVVTQAAKISVDLNDQREKTAELVGMDEALDVALIKITAHNLPIVRIGDSDRLSVGQWVVAIGAPFGLKHSATQGIVSALGRSLPAESYVPYIQTDVALNPGNSGGPLFNVQGEVVGINAEIFSSTGGYMGLSFAVPINSAMRAATQIKRQGFVSHGWLGVVIQAVNQDLAESFGLKRPHGALIAEPLANSPAARAGLKSGDIILRYNGKTIDKSSRLPFLVGRTPIGRSVPVTILRAGRQKQVKVTIEALRKNTTGGAAEQGSRLHKRYRDLRLAATNLTDRQRRRLGIDTGGVRVTDVGGGLTAEVGIRPGDIILTLDRQAVDNVRQLQSMVARLPRGKPVAVLVLRNGGLRYTTLKLSRRG